MLCRPTNVAAASCHALFPESSHFGDGTSIDLSPIFLLRRTSQPPVPNRRANERTTRKYTQKPCHLHDPNKKRPRTRIFPGKPSSQPLAFYSNRTKVRQIRFSRPSQIRGPLCRECGFGYGSVQRDVDEIPKPG